LRFSSLLLTEGAGQPLSAFKLDFLSQFGVGIVFSLIRFSTRVSCPIPTFFRAYPSPYSVRTLSDLFGVFIGPVLLLPVFLFFLASREGVLCATEIFCCRVLSTAEPLLRFWICAVAVRSRAV
jgi:hypothetical protein